MSTDLKMPLIRDPITVSYDCPAQSALEAWYKAIPASQPHSQSSQCLVVLQGSRCLGLIQAQELLSILLQHRDLQTTTIGTLTPPPRLTLHPEDLENHNHTLALLQQHQLEFAPVVDSQEHFLGLISRSSLLSMTSPISDTYFRTVYETSTIGIALCSSTGLITAANDYFLNLVGYDQNILQDPGLDYANLLPSGSHTQLQSRVKRPSSRKIYRHQQGHPIYVLESLTPIFDQEWMIIVVDISAQVLGEDRLRRSEACLVAARQMAGLGTWSYDLHTQAITWSAEIFHMFDRPPELGPANLEELQAIIATSPAHNLELLHQAIETAQPHELEGSFQRSDGSLGYFRARGEPIINTEGQVTELVGVVMETTAQQTAARLTAELIQELSAFKEALEQVASVAIISLDGTILSGNQRLSQSSGYSLSELVGHSYHLIKSGIQPNSFYNNLYTTLERGDIWQEEVCHRTKNGELYWELETIVPLRNQLGHTSKYLSICFDITRHKESELALQQKTQELDHFFLMVPDLLCIASHDGRFLRLNPQWENLLGYPLSELENSYFINYVHTEDQERTRIALVESREKVLKFINRYRCQDGSFRWLEWLSVPFGDRIYASARDVTERIIAETTSQRRVEREKLLLHITERIRKSLDLETIFTIACEEIRQVLQADRVSIFQFSSHGQSGFGQIISESSVPSFASMIRRTIEDKYFQSIYKTLEVQKRAITPSNNERETDFSNVLKAFDICSSLSIALFCEEKLWGFLWIQQCSYLRQWEASEIDFVEHLANQLAIAIQQANLVSKLQTELAERYKTQEQLTQRNQELALMNQELARVTHLKDEFLANMSHELRTPLNAIIGMSEALQDHIFGSINPAQEKALDTIQKSASHLLELINDILDVAKIESGHLQLNYSNVAVAPLCYSCLAFIKQTALKKQIQLLTDIPDNLPDLFVDERRVRQILINLLTNAVKFTPEGGKITLAAGIPCPLPITTDIPPAQNQQITILPTPCAPLFERQLGIPLEEKQPMIRIAVSDTGIGIAAEQIPKLFQPFVQIDSALNRQYSGTGLGLSLVKRLVDLHGGRIALGSEVGIGSCFVVDLPCVVTSLPVSAATPEPHTAHFGGSSPLVLLAEDNEANVFTISSYLRAKGYELIIAKDGAQAITLAQNSSPDIILMDIQMPKIDGLQAITAIRQDPRHQSTPIIALTALAMPGDQERCLAAGATDYITKPVKLKFLLNRIQTLLVSKNHETSQCSSSQPQ